MSFKVIWLHEVELRYIPLPVFSFIVLFVTLPFWTLNKVMPEFVKYGVPEPPLAFENLHCVMVK